MWGGLLTALSGVTCSGSSAAVGSSATSSSEGDGVTGCMFDGVCWLLYHLSHPFNPACMHQNLEAQHERREMHKSIYNHTLVVARAHVIQRSKQ